MGGSLFTPVSVRAAVAGFVLAIAVPSAATADGGDDLAVVVVEAGRTRWTSNNRVELLADPDLDIESAVEATSGFAIIRPTAGEKK